MSRGSGWVKRHEASGIVRRQGARGREAAPGVERYWTLRIDELFLALRTGRTGLTTAEAQSRLKAYGPNAIHARRSTGAWALVLRQLRSPQFLLLTFAALASLLVTQWIDAAIIGAILVVSAVLGFLQEHRASRAMARLQAQVRVTAVVLRDGSESSLPAENVVPGDLVRLAAGGLVPADGVVVESNDCLVDQAALTGEAFPVEKRACEVPPDAPLAERSNSLFMGTSVRSGDALMLVVETGPATVYGELAGRLGQRQPETEFERGLRRFGYMLTQFMLVLVFFVLTINVVFARPAVEALLFAIALAVGVTPEMLPAIVSLTLARGGERMARRGVMARRLVAIESFGSMNVLCSDKTGTLSEGVMGLEAAVATDGSSSDAVLEAAFLNSALQAGFTNPLDQAVMAAGSARGLTVPGHRKVAEFPYDFARRRLGVVVEDDRGQRELVVKGAFAQVLEACTTLKTPGEDGETPLDDAWRRRCHELYRAWGESGNRVLAVARRPVALGSELKREALERDLTLVGFLRFIDPPKVEAAETVRRLADLGVQLKVVTGDNRYVSRHLAEAVGLSATTMLTGAELDAMSDEALWHAAPRVDVFAEVDPNQKVRIIRALQRGGSAVGYLGDGINDAPALHLADVGISVAGAADVAREAADLVLSQHDLGVLLEGVLEGRKTFANTLKYIFVTTSANFGNMVSMALASLGLPFLPLLAKQILLNNLLSDVPALALADDTVDESWSRRPRRWRIGQIRAFMLVFGTISSAFDFLTFGLLLWVFRATPEVFRTGWFVESLLTELVIIFVVRTRRPLFASRPSHLLLAASAAVAATAIALPYLPVGAALGFVRLPAPVILALVAFTAAYGLVSEAAKRRFFSWDDSVTRKTVEG